MAVWKDNLRQASFRGVPFQVDDDEERSGDGYRFANTPTGINPIPKILGAPPDALVLALIWSVMIFSRPEIGLLRLSTRQGQERWCIPVTVKSRSVSTVK